MTGHGDHAKPTETCTPTPTPTLTPGTQATTPPPPGDDDTSTTTPPVTTTPPATTAATTTHPVVDPVTLPVTGPGAVSIAVTGLLFLLAGVVAVVWAMVRRAVTDRVS